MKKKYIKPICKIIKVQVEHGYAGSVCSQFDIEVVNLNKKKTKINIIDNEKYWNSDF